MSSGYIQAQRNSSAAEASAPTLEEEIRRIVDRLRVEGPTPPQEFMEVIGSFDKSHFTSNMTSFSLEILGRCKATKRSTILDLGCGCGRLALPICEYLGGEGAYIGVDVWPAGIAWCNEFISSKSERFSFHCVEAKNNYYFDACDESTKNEYQISFVDGESVDVAFAISLFTHLRRDDALAYMKEIKRTLKPDGVAYITCFIIDHFFYRYVAATGNHQAVKESPLDPECYYAYSGQDFFAGFSLKVWNEMLQAAGLWAVSREPGSWAQKPGARVYQDTFILTHI